MKRLMHLCMPVLFLLAACSKEKSFEVSTGGNPGGGGNGGGNGGGAPSGYTFQCKIDGALKTFNVGTVAAKQTIQGTTAYTIGGKATTGTDLEVFALTITMNNGTLAPGTYAIDDASGNFFVAGQYMFPSGQQALQAGSGDTSDNPFSITVTSISSTEIAGTFKGKMAQIDVTNPNPPTNPPTKTITEGQFKVKFQ